MRLLVTGADGQVGWELTRSLVPLGSVLALDHQKCDLVRLRELTDHIVALSPDVIVNAAGYTAVDKAEAEEASAEIVNGKAVGVLAAAARASNALLVHYSTDYVFDGCKDGAYVEDDPPGPINAYGRSKLTGELAIGRSRCDYLILRTSWVYAARGQNFVRTVLRLADEHDGLSIVADQVGTPNWARHLADATAHIVRVATNDIARGAFAPGIFHLTASGSTSWHGFAAAILELAKSNGLISKQPRLEAISTEGYPRPAARPKNSRLSSDRLRSRFGISLPDWKSSLALCMQEIKCAKRLFGNSV